MQPVTIGLVALLVSLVLVSQSPSTSRFDARTLTVLVTAVFVASAAYLRISLQMVFVYVALAIVSSMVVVYWARQGLVHFKESLSPDYPVPLWLPFFFAQGFFSVHLFYNFLVSYRYLDEED